VSALAAFFIGLFWGLLLGAALGVWFRSRPRCESLADKCFGSPEQFFYRCAHKKGHDGPHESPGGMVHWR
jgi:hypothetical protein